MLYCRQGTPEVDEIILCKVTKIYPNSVFVDILEYDKIGVVYISEVAPGRIRNLRDYVDIGRQIICKVLRVDQATGNIDLSLRRVNSTQRSEKLEEIKQELKAETLLKSVCEKMHKKMEEVYPLVSKKIFVEYSHLYLCFREVSNGKANLEKIGISKDIATELTQVISEKFRPPKVLAEGEITLSTYAPNGIEKIKDALLEIKKVSPSTNLVYLGGGRYKFSIEDVDYKVIEKNIKSIESIVEKFKDKSSTATIQREKKE